MGITPLPHKHGMNKNTGRWIMNHGTQRMEEGRSVIVLIKIKITLYTFLHVECDVLHQALP